MTLAELVTQAMPILVHSHSISFNPIEAAYRATPESVSSWETFRAEVATFCSTLANSDPCYNTKPFPLSLGGACEILVSAAGQSSAGITITRLTCLSLLSAAALQVSATDSSMHL